MHVWNRTFTHRFLSFPPVEFLAFNHVVCWLIAMLVHRHHISVSTTGNFRSRASLWVCGNNTQALLFFVAENDSFLSWRCLQNNENIQSDFIQVHWGTYAAFIWWLKKYYVLCCYNTQQKGMNFNVSASWQRRTTQKATDSTECIASEICLYPLFPLGVGWGH